MLYPLRRSLARAPGRVPDFAGLLTPQALTQVDADGGILAHLRARERPRWFPAPSIARDEPDLFPDEAAASLGRAERVLSGEYRFLNVEAPWSGNPPDWCLGPSRSKEWVYLLNRFHYLLDVARAYRYTNRDEFVTAGMELVNDWICRNPEGHPTTWESVSCAWRIENWLAALLHFLPSARLTDTWTSHLLASVARHAEHLRRHIEYDLAGNHLLFEAKGLIIAGLMLPEMLRADVWYREGMELLRHEMARQVLPDGGHAELATHYHVEITLLLTEVAVLLDRNGVRKPSGLTDTLGRMYRFLLWLTRPDGDIPMLGDSVRDDPIVARRLLGLGFAYLGQPELGAMAEGGAQVDRLLGSGCSRRLAASEVRPPPDVARAFPNSGCAVVRSGWTDTADYLVWDCGAFGMRGGPGHGHADQLSFELVVGGATVVLDPGVYQYEAGAWRDYFRGVSAHNTLRLGGRDPCLMWSAYRVIHPPRTRLLGWVALPGLAVGEAEHDGYIRDMATTHRRALLWLDRRVWVVSDWLYPISAGASWEVFFHFAPNADLTLDGCRFRAVIPGTNTIEGTLLGTETHCSVVRGGVSPIQGWVSYGFGEKLKAPVLVVSGAAPPSPLITLLGCAGEVDGWGFEEAGPGAAVLTRRTDHRRTIIGIRGPLSPGLAHRELETDGRIAMCELRDERLSRAVLIGGRYLNWNGSPLLQAHETVDFVKWDESEVGGILYASSGVQVRTRHSRASPASRARAGVDRAGSRRPSAGGTDTPSHGKP
jgi:hypothetical protein